MENDFEPPLKKVKLSELSDDENDTIASKSKSEEDKRRRREKLAAWKSTLSINLQDAPKKVVIAPFSLLGSKKHVDSVVKPTLEILDYSAAEAQVAPSKSTGDETYALLDPMDFGDHLVSKNNQIETSTTSNNDLNSPMNVSETHSQTKADLLDSAISSTNDVASTSQVDEDDPLDAFMSTIDDEVSQLKQESMKKALEETQKSSSKFSSSIASTSSNSQSNQNTDTSSKSNHNQSSKLMTGDDLDEEFDYEDEFEDDIAKLAKVNVKKHLEVVDHSKIAYEPFKKDFYIEVPDLARLTEEEVVALRATLDGIRIRGKDCPKPIKSFSQSGLSANILDRLKKLKFEKPTPIQAQALPAIMSGRDVIGIAKTGSGKTLAFLLPLFRHILSQRDLIPGDGPIALIMVPTRELATQIHSDIREFKASTGIISCCIYGGAEMSGQIADLKRGAHIVVCTPGRMIEMLTMNKGRITNLKRVTYLVLDEADRMFDLGFEQQIMKIVNNVRPDRQTVMFSATFPRNVEVAARKILVTPLEITVHGRSVVSDTIHQIIEIRDHSTKFFRLMELIAEWYPQGSILVFAESQDAVDALFHNVIRSGYNCLSFHAGRDQMDRDETIQEFKNGTIKILIATSGASRGLDVPNLKLVVNYDVPNHLEDYVHRVGRTGRAGATGTAVTFIAPDEDQYAPDLVKALKQSKASVPADLEKMANQFEEKTKKGLARKHVSGFEGKGYQFNEEEDKQRKAALNSLKLHFGGELAEEALAKDDEEHPEVEDEDEDLIETTQTSTADSAKASTSQQQHVDGMVSNEELAKMTPAQRAAAEKFNELLLAKFGKAKAPVTTATGTDKEVVPEVHYDCEIEINDFPQNVRRKVTSKDTFVDLVELTGVAITPKGIYVPPGKPVPPGERKLYLSVEGPNQEAINAARQGIKAVLESTMAALAMRGDRPTGRYSVVD